MRQRIETVGHALLRQLPHERGQHRQQRHPLATHIDAQIEREPPAAAFGYRGRPLAAAVHDAMAKAVLELDPPTLGFERRYRFVDEARPSCRILVQTQREIGAIAAAFAEIASWSQTQPS